MNSGHYVSVSGFLWAEEEGMTGWWLQTNMGIAFNGWLRRIIIN